jgi:hypothetical protein
MPLSGPVRPGSYDFSFHAWFDGLGAVGFFYRNPELAEPPPGCEATAAPARPIWVEGIRLSLAERVRAQIGGPEGEIAATLIAGIRAGIPEETAEALRRTGMAHILAISGLHMALVAGTVLLGFRIAFALFPGFLLAPSGQEICRARRALGLRLLSGDIGSGGRRAAQLHHAGGDADGAALRPGGADHAQSGDRRAHRHRDLAA